MPFTPIETQEQLDAVIRERIERAERKAAEQFADYDQLKEKAERLDKMEAASKSELQKANEELAKLHKQASDREAADKLSALRSKVSKATGVPAELISGTDEDAMTACAEGIAKFAKRPAAPVVPGSGSRASGDGNGGDMREFVSQLIPSD